MVVITGPIDAGKTTLAAALAARFGAVHLASDALRGAHGHPFDRMTRALETARIHGRPVVLDSTGMSYRFRALLAAIRVDAYHVHLLVDEPRWRAREAGRSDRAALSVAIFRRSAAVSFATPPDAVIDTSPRRPAEVAAVVGTLWERS